MAEEQRKNATRGGSGMNPDELLDAARSIVPELLRCMDSGTHVSAGLRDSVREIRDELYRNAVDVKETDPKAFSVLIRLHYRLDKLLLQCDSRCKSGKEPEKAAQETAPKDPWAEIRTLHRLLEEAGIPHRFLPHITGSGYQLVYYGHQGPPAPVPGRIHGPGLGSVYSAIQTPASYGHEEGLIEVQGLGEVTAQKAFEAIRRHWEEA